MSSVFVVNFSGHDLSDAKRFGELVIMSRDLLPLYHPIDLLRRFDPFISKSEPGDYILQSGPNIANSIACAMFAAKHQRLNLLLFNSKEYIAREILFRGE